MGLMVPARGRSIPRGNHPSRGAAARCSIPRGTMTTTFAELNLRPDLLEALASLGYEEPTPIQREAIPPLLAGQGSARAGRDRHRQDRRLRAAAPAAPRDRPLAARRSALVLVPTRELAVQVSQALHRYGRAHRRARDADLRRPADHPPARRAASAASTSSSPRPAARSTTSPAAPQARRAADGRARRGRRDARHGLRRGPRGDLRRHARRRARPCSSARRCRRGSSRWRAARLRDPERITIDREPAPTDGAPLVRQSAYVVARAHKPAALGRVLDIESPDRRARLLPHARRGRPARRDAQRPRLPRRGAARRHDAGPARPRDGAPAQRDLRPDRRHRRRRPRPGHRPAHARRQLRRPVRPRLLHAPHRPRRPRRARRRRDHARRAARAPDAQDDRARDPPEDHGREAADRRRPARAPPRADARRDRGDPRRGRTSSASASCSTRSRASTTWSRSRSPRSSSPTRPPASSTTTRTRSPRSASRAPKTRQRQGRAPQHDAAVHRRRPHRRRAPARPRRARSRASRASTAARSARSRSPTASRSSRSPTSSAHEVIAALRASTIKGKKATVRRDRTAPPKKRR